MNNFSSINQSVGTLVDPTSNPASIKAQTSITTSSLTESRFWREFSAGMQMLMQYREHIKGDIRPILQHNLLLLYQTFKHDACFQQQLDGLAKQRPGIWNPLAKTTDMNCGIVKISTQNINLKPILRQISICESRNSVSYQQKRIHEQGLLIMLVLKGKLNTGGARLVKSGHIYVQAIDSDFIHVKSATKNCQLLMLAIT